MYLSVGAALPNWTTDLAPLIQADFIKRFPNDYRDVVVTIVDDKKHVINDEPQFLSTYTDGVRIYIKGFSNKLPTTNPVILASVNITKLDTNCGVAIVGNLNVLSTRTGVGKWLMAWTLHILAHRGFTIAIGTTNHAMSSMVELLKKCKWTEINELAFVNNRSGSPIKFWRIYLKRGTGILGQDVPYFT